MVMASLRGNKGVNPYILIRLSNFFFEDPTYTSQIKAKSEVMLDQSLHITEGTTVAFKGP